MSTIKVTNIQDTSGGNSSTSAEIYQGRVRAWVVFNGSGTVSIDNDFNVSTIGDNGTGRYTVNFTTAFTNANYVAAGTAGNDGTTTSGRKVGRDGIWTTSACQLRDSYGSTAVDDVYICAMFIGE